MQMDMHLAAQMAHREPHNAVSAATDHLCPASRNGPCRLAPGTVTARQALAVLRAALSHLIPVDTIVPLGLFR